MNFRRNFIGGSWRALFSIIVVVIGLCIHAYLRTTMNWAAPGYQLYECVTWLVIFAAMAMFSRLIQRRP
jgi:formate-dependent nitrite reductase membrane component NrfD